MDDNEGAGRAAPEGGRQRRAASVFRLAIIALLSVNVILLFLVVRRNTESMRRYQENMEAASGTVSDELPLTENVTEFKNDMEEQTSAETETEVKAQSEIIEQAQRLAAMYDYDGAIALLQGDSSYAQSQEMADKVAEWEYAKQNLVEYSPEEVTHIFFHTLIKDTSLAFDGDAKADGYNQVMTTIDEFNKIIQSMYEKGYVLVSMHDMCTVNEDGTVSEGTILLPADKKPFVLSQDDVCYYHYMDGDGMATKLVIDENGDVKAEYEEQDGSVSVGDYDLVPLIDSFVDEHPDFSYHGAKGTIALTGYNGVLGYRTDIAYKTRENLDVYQEQFFLDNPDFDEDSYNAEVAQATEVANAMKQNGWEFASHTWGHIDVDESDLSRIQTDTEKWISYVQPIVGETDIIIFAFGSDIGDWQEYTDENEKFVYLKSMGFNIYCNVDGSQYWVQFGDNYMRQGRRNLDGYRMYYNPEMLEDLFDVSEVFDLSRPTPVPEM